MSTPSKPAFPALSAALPNLLTISSISGIVKALGISLWKSFLLFMDTAEAATGGPSYTGFGSRLAAMDRRGSSA